MKKALEVVQGFGGRSCVNPGSHGAIRTTIVMIGRMVGVRIEAFMNGILEESGSEVNGGNARNRDR
jgi:hypothetical protein